MRLPEWLRVIGRARRSPGSVAVTLEADVSRFVAAMEEAGESLSRQRYRYRVRREQIAARAHVDGLLDDLCRRWGMDPVEVWRVPRAREQRDRRDRAAMLAAWRAGAAVLESRRPVVGGDVS